jgi:hypothetical protein
MTAKRDNMIFPDAIKRKTKIEKEASGACEDV